MKINKEVVFVVETLDGTILSLTRKEAERLRDGLDAILDDEEKVSVHIPLVSPFKPPYETVYPGPPWKTDSKEAPMKARFDR
jgi:hypothetical protein